MTPTLLLLAILAAPSPLVDLATGVGASTNPYEMPLDPEAAGTDAKELSGGFVPVAARFRWRTRLGEPLRLSAEADLDGIFFAYVAPAPPTQPASRVQDLHRVSGDLAFPVVLNPMSRRGFFRLDLTVEPFAAFNRETYTSHRTGRPLVVQNPDPDGIGPDEVANLARRYDSNEGGVTLELDSAFGKDVDVVIGGRLTVVDHVEDYRSYETVDSWDHAELRADADVFWAPSGWLLAAGYTVRRLEYEERFPREETGAEILPDDAGYAPQVFQMHHMTLKGGIVRDRGRVVFRWRGTRRLDLFAGYLDYTENRVSGDFRWTFGRRGFDARVSPAYSVRRYDRLRVRYDPQEPVSNRNRFSLEGTLEWPALSEWISLFVGASVVSQTSANPLFTYVDCRALTGVRVRIR